MLKKFLGNQECSLTHLELDKEVVLKFGFKENKITFAELIR